MWEQTVFGVRVRVSIWFPTVVALLCLLDKSGSAAVCLYASLWHECGHLGVAALLRVPPHTLCFGAFGMRMEQRGTISYARQFFIAAAGPLCNLLAAAVLWRLGEQRVAVIHLVLGGFNALPIRPLDGGTALLCALKCGCSDRAAETAVAVTSVLAVIPLTAAAVWALWDSGYNFSLLLVCVYLIFLLLYKKKD